MKDKSIMKTDPSLGRAIILSLGSIIGFSLFLLSSYFAAPYLQSLLSASFALFVRFCEVFGYANIILSFLSAWVMMTYVMLRAGRSGTPQREFAQQYAKIAYLVAAIMFLNILFFIGYYNSSLPLDEFRWAGCMCVMISTICSVAFCANVLDKVHDRHY